MPVRRLVLLLLSFGLLASTAAAQEKPAVEPEARKHLEGYLAAIAKVKDMTYVLSKSERMRDGEVVRETLKVKLRVKPYATYMARLKPSKGMEAIYRAGKNDGEMTVHKGSFPDVTLNLDPLGSLAMENQHFPITGTGLAAVTRRVERALALAKQGLVSIRMKPNQKVGKVDALCVEIDASRVKTRRVKAREDETLFQLAKREKSWVYVIYTLNPDIDDLDDELDEDDEVVVPGYYALRTELCIDPRTKLVVRESYFDARGLYERYDTLDRKTNVGLKEKDFDPDNSAYDF